MVRKIRISDAEAVLAMSQAELGHKSSVELIRQRIAELADDSHYYIAVYEEDSTKEVVGFIQAEKYNLLYGGNGFNIIALAVAKKQQGKGYGKKLLFSLEDTAKEMGYTFVRLNSNVVRQDAHAFYQHLGYDCDKTQKRLIKNF